MKREWQIKVLVLVVVGVVILVAKFLPPAMAYWGSSEVYKRYSRVEGVRATYVKDFRVNDTLTVGVTLLEATDSAGWDTLKEDYGLVVIPRELEEKYSCDSNKVLVRNYPKTKTLYLGGDTLTDDIAAISYYKHSIIHFVIMSKEQKRAILYKQFDDNINIKKT